MSGFPAITPIPCTYRYLGTGEEKGKPMTHFARMNKKRMRYLPAMIVAAMGILQVFGGECGIYFEVETQPAESPWELRTETDGYLGSGYFFWAGEDNWREPAPEGIMSYSFSVEEKAQYVLEFRGRRNHDGVCAGEADDQCNDIFARVKEHEEWKKHMIKKMGWDAWGWEATVRHGGKKDHLVPPTGELEPGTYTVEFAGRSKGVLIDAFRIYKTGTTPPVRPCDQTSVRPADRMTQQAQTHRRSSSSSVRLYTIHGRRIGPAAQSLPGIRIETRGAGTSLQVGVGSSTK